MFNVHEPINQCVGTPFCHSLLCHAIGKNQINRGKNLKVHSRKIGGKVHEKKHEEGKEYFCSAIP